MYIDFGTAVSALPAIHAALGCEPHIRPNLSGLTADKLPLLLLSLMNSGVRTPAAMHQYLDDHGAPFDLESVVDALDENMATMGFANETADGLWRHGRDGFLMPTIVVSR